MFEDDAYVNMYAYVSIYTCTLVCIFERLCIPVCAQKVVCLAPSEHLPACEMIFPLKRVHKRSIEAKLKRKRRATEQNKRRVLFKCH